MASVCRLRTCLESLRVTSLQNGTDQSGLLQLQGIWVHQTMTLIEIGMFAQWDVVKGGHMTRPGVSASVRNQPLQIWRWYEGRSNVAICRALLASNFTAVECICSVIKSPLSCSLQDYQESCQIRRKHRSIQTWCSWRASLVILPQLALVCRNFGSCARYLPAAWEAATDISGEYSTPNANFVREWPKFCPKIASRKVPGSATRDYAVHEVVSEGAGLSDEF